MLRALRLSPGAVVGVCWRLVSSGPRLHPLDAPLVSPSAATKHVSGLVKGPLGEGLKHAGEEPVLCGVKPGGKGMSIITSSSSSLRSFCLLVFPLVY